MALIDLVRELCSLNDYNLAERVITDNDVQWCLSELLDILEQKEERLEPLTLEELRKIDTVIPLWVHNLSWGQHKPRLMLVRHVTSNYWSCVDFDGFETIKSDDYGSRYLIYRRPPEEEV